MKKNKAFTLIELLVVVLIIGTLAAIAVPQYQKAVEKANIAQAITTANYLKNLEKAYFLANGTYTNNFETLGTDVAGATFSKDKKNMYVKQYHITLLDANLNRILIRHNSSSPKYVLDVRLNSSTNACTSYKDDSHAGASICQNLSGKKEPSSTTGCGEDGKCKSWYF